MCRNIYRDLETINVAGIMGLWHIELIGPVKPMLKGDKAFITRGGDPTREGGKKYGEPFNDEFHTRLRFCRRDLITMTNAGKDDNGLQFFFTLSSTLNLQNKHTIFGAVVVRVCVVWIEVQRVAADARCNWLVFVFHREAILETTRRIGQLTGLLTAQTLGILPLEDDMNCTLAAKPKSNAHDGLQSERFR
ncbi:Peptidyl-prolyl cis-trans isomerase CWC27 like protein [Eufriesea mexicana]|uniref:Peptidyl-prolyl cis-trans isomerase n=1 Tax=Eufriesea mexicana TaxID=516756 RepID=A0A310SF17_9HYME|nr:Peptidyl-prolyl cis-trans isomerase CWC27 like protein [Eufriesea mexicana]